MTNKKNVNSILCVIVLYNTDLNSSISYNSLIKNENNLNIEFNKLIYNNSDNIKIKESTSYYVYNSNENTMLAKAYNYALDIAKKNGIKWLLLLDQDSKLSKDYFLKIETFLNSEIEEDTVAIVPKLKNNQFFLSPVLNYSEYNTWWFQKKVYTEGYYNNYITAFNSGTLFNVDFMISIGGFSEKYPLDRLDYWCFLQVYKNKKKTYVLNTELEHDLSILNYKRNMNLERYQSILNAEITFAREVGNKSLFFYKTLIFFRFVKQVFFMKNKKYAYATFLQLWK